MIKRFHIFLIIYIITYLVTDINAKNNDSTFIDMIYAKKQYFLSKLNDTILSIPKDRRFKEQLNIEIPFDFNENDKIGLLHCLITVGSQIKCKAKLIGCEGVYGISSLFIEDDEVYRIVIKALSDDEFDIQRRAYDILLKYSSYKNIKKYSKEIKEGVFKYQCAYYNDQKNYIKKHIKRFGEKDYKRAEEGFNHCNENNGSGPCVSLFILLTLTEKEKKLILAYQNSLHYKAILGDKNAEKRLIEQYEKEKDFRKKGKLAAKLSMVGSDKCIKTLIHSLYSPMKEYDSQGIGYVSIRISIINSLLKQFPDAEFKNEFLVITRRFLLTKRELLSDNCIKIKNQQKIFDSIIAWAGAKYKTKPQGIPLSESEPVFFKSNPDRRIIE